MAVFGLVHGSAQGSAGWQLLVTALEERGHGCICVDLPTDQPDASATEYARVIGSAIAHLDGAIVVGHSISGLFLPLVPEYGSVQRLVYLAAAVPLPGASFRSQVEKDPSSYRPDFLRVRPPIDDEVALHYLFHDCRSEVVPWALSSVRMMYARRAIVEPCPLKEWPRVDSTYISCTEDRTINPEWWEGAARERLGVEPVRMEAGHAPFVSRPKELAEILAGLI